MYMYKMLLKNINNAIKDKRLDYQDVKDKIDLFVKRGRITNEEYEELNNLIEPFKPKK